MSKTQNTPTPTVIILTLPEPESEGTLFIQRGDLAHMSQFSYTTETDFTALIQKALAALAVVESDPPVIPDEPPRRSRGKRYRKAIGAFPCLLTNHQEHWNNTLRQWVGRYARRTLSLFKEFKEDRCHELVTGWFMLRHNLLIRDASRTM